MLSRTFSNLNWTPTRRHQHYCILYYICIVYLHYVRIFIQQIALLLLHFQQTIRRGHVQVQRLLRSPFQQPLVRRLKRRAERTLWSFHTASSHAIGGTIRSPCYNSDNLHELVYHPLSNVFHEHCCNRIPDGVQKKVVVGCFDHSNVRDWVDKTGIPYFLGDMLPISPNRNNTISRTQEQ